MTMQSINTANEQSTLPTRLATRWLDLILSLLLLTLLWPVLLIIALAVVLTSRGPVLFEQTRIGQHGVPFKMVKFRSMYADAEVRRAALIHQSDREGLCLKIRKDPRITPIGRILRRWSLDELPQIFNVLKGDMSLVGPRPALPQEVAEYPQNAHRRHLVLPGITGLWQVSGRAEIGFDEMIELDLHYVRTASVPTNIIILLRTFGAVITGRGAY